MSTVVSVVLALFGLLAAALLGALWFVLKAAVSQEAASVLPAATRSLLHRAKMRLPGEAQPRWEEEWPAGFHDAIEKRPIWAFREAVSLYLGAGRIARELKPAPVVAGQEASGRQLGAMLITQVVSIRGRISRAWVAFREFDQQIAKSMNRMFDQPAGFPFAFSLVFVRWFSYVFWPAVICGLIYLVAHGAESLIG